jgi:hypothetical protein
MWKKLLKFHRTAKLVGWYDETIPEICIVLMLILYIICCINPIR